MRIEYLEAALNQDIQYFDTEVRTSDIVFAINTDAALVQDAISEKVRFKMTYLFYFSFFLFGFTQTSLFSLWVLTVG